VSNAKSSRIFWHRFDRCDECGADEATVCMTMANKKADEPCEGRRRLPEYGGAKSKK
jgi:hypothetical protein